MMDMRASIRHHIVAVTALVAALTLTSCTGQGDPGHTPAGTPTADVTSSWPDAPDLHPSALSGLDQTPLRAWNVTATAIDSAGSQLWPEAASDGILAVSVQAAAATDTGEPTTWENLTQVVGVNLGDGSLAWRHNLEPGTLTDCADITRGGALICTTRGSEGGRLWTLDLATGKPLYTIDVPGLTAGVALAPDRNRVFVPTCDPSLNRPGIFAWDIGQQSAAWQIQLEDGTECDPAASGPLVQTAGTIVVVDLDGVHTQVVDADTGDLMPGISGSTVVTSTGDLLTDSGSYDPKTGKTIVAGTAQSLNLNNGFVIDKSSQKMQILQVADTTVRLHARSDGHALWDAGYSDDAKLIAVCSQTLFFAGPNLGDYAIDMATGKRIWAREDVHIGFDSGFCGDQSFIVINSVDGGLTSISAANGRTNWILDSPAEDPGSVPFWWALDGHLFMTVDGALSLWR